MGQTIQQQDALAIRNERFPDLAERKWKNYLLNKEAFAALGIPAPPEPESDIDQAIRQSRQAPR